jgi:inner membrane protein
MIAITAVKLNGLAIAGHTYTPALGLISVAAGSYMPDIDLHRSRMGSRHRIISKLLTHRGITHTLLVPVILFFLMLQTAALDVPILPDLILGFNVGWVMHILADLCNNKGVPLLWPLSKKHLHIASFLTGSWQETVFIVLWAGVNAVCAYFLSR